MKKEKAPVQAKKKPVRYRQREINLLNALRNAESADSRAKKGISSKGFMYNAAVDLRSSVADARTQLLHAAKSGEVVEVLDISSPQVGTVTCTGEYQPDHSAAACINVYSFVVFRSKYSQSGDSTILYYYTIPDE